MKLDKSFNPYWQHFGTITEPHLRKQKRNSSLKKLTSVDQAPPSGGYFNSPGTEIFPFSYFAFTLLKLRKVIKNIKKLFFNLANKFKDLVCPLFLIFVPRKFSK